MKKTPLLLLSLLILFTTNSCFKDNDDEFQAASSLEIQNFIYQAMNIWYLYKPNVSNLADDRFATQDELNDFLDNYETPEDLYHNGLVADVDRFSFITDDYRELENSFAGVTLNNGLDYALSLNPNDESLAFGIVRLVLPGTSADEEGVERGMLFNTIDGETLGTTASGGGRSLDNRSRELLAQDTYTIGLATIDDDNNIVATGESIILTKEEYTENPVYITKTLDVNGQKVGYIMYNAFTANFDEDLNNAFSQLKGEGITELVLDLRYNGGGSVRTATDLSAMITGQFAGEIFSTEVWNPQIQAILEENDAESLENRFNTNLRSGTAINSLNLNRIFVLTTGSTASASELVINGLDPYISVVQIGTTTTGKFQASTTFYDSEAPNFQRDGASQDHFYAIQPLIFTSANADGVTGFVNGLEPDIELNETIRDFGVLGDSNEPLLAAALLEISEGRAAQQIGGLGLEVIGERKMNDPNYQRMYVDLQNKE